MSDYARDVKKILTKAGCFFLRHGRGDHDVWESPLTGERFTVDHEIKSRHTANGILKSAGLEKEF